MSQAFSLKYDRMKENVSEMPADSQSGIERYEHAGHDRKLCFIFSDGNRIRLNYAYLIWDEFYPEENRIVLSFTSHTITLSGRYLGKLYDDLEKNMPRIIPSVDARYNLTSEDETPVVNEIKIVTN